MTPEKESPTFHECEMAVVHFLLERPSMYDHNIHGAGVEISLALEVAEVLELRKMRDFLDNREYKKRLGSELADVMVYALTLSHIHDIDLGREILDKVELNEKRFPINNFQGDRNDFSRQYYQLKFANGERK